MDIKKILETKEGAIKLKEKLDSMTEEDKSKPNYNKINSLVCDALKGFGVQPKKKKRKGWSDTYSNEKKKECVADLNKMLPNNMFDLKDPKPLSIGLGKELLDMARADENISTTRVRAGVGFFTNTQEYYLALIVKKKRYNIKGEYVADVTDEQVEVAKQKFIERFGKGTYKKELAKAQRKQERESQ